MKILMALMGLEIGGAETHVMELALELSRQGHQVVIASNGGVYVEPLERAGVRHISVPMNQRNPLKMMKSLSRLEQAIRQEKPDIVHAHARIPAFLCGILQRRMGFPFITSAHWVFEVTPLLRRMTNWGSRTVAVSEDIKTYLKTQYQVPEDQIHVTINGINTELFSPDQEHPALKAELGLGDGPVIGLVSRLDESRALAAEKLLSVMPSLLEKYPNVQFLLVGGGDREETLRQRAEAVNRQAGKTAVVMTGPRTDIAALLSLCTVFVGVSRSALEAMAEEKPVLLAGNEGYMGLFTKDRLERAQESNFCCRGCPPVTEETLREDLMRLLSSDFQTRKALGADGRQVILDMYSVTRMTADYLTAYDRLLHGKKPVKAVISGYYGYDNLGDDAILYAISKQLSALEPPVRLTVLSRRPKETAACYGLRAVSRFSPVAVFRAIRKSDILISGGGSLLQDRTSTRSVRYYLGVIRLAQLLKKPVFLYANGIGPLSREKNRRRVCRCIENCHGVTLRDSDSLLELKTLGVTRQDIHVTADPAFTLNGDDRGRQRLSALGIPTEGPLLGISLRRVPGIEEQIPQFAALFDKIAREQGKTLVFFVMQESLDRELSLAVMEQMEAPAYLAASPMDPAGMLSMLRCMDALVSMRLHTIIFAARERVPAVGCVYDPKITAFLQMLGLPSCGTPENLEAQTAYETVAEVLDHLTAYRETLEQRVSKLEETARQTPVCLLQMLRDCGKVETDVS